MSQDSVLRLLEKEGKPLSSLEIAKKLKITKKSVSTNARKLREQNDVKVIYKGHYRVAHYFV